MFAAIDGHDRIARQLINSRSDVNVVDKEGNTTLMLAVRSGHEDVVRSLLAACPDLELMDGNGKTVLQLAEEKQAHRIIELLNSPPPCK
jgi:ankyrin repeat-rich membrane spanning protein